MAFLNVLCIDDDPKIHLLLNEVFRRKGHSYSYGLTGEQGLSILEKENFDIVIIDLKLPDMQGLEICGRIRSNSDNSNLILVIVSAHLHDADKFRQFVSTLNVDLIIQKPFNPSKLLEMLSLFIIDTESNDDSDKISEPLLKLRKKYLDDVPEKLDELKKTIETILDSKGDIEKVKELQAQAHKIHGNAGIFGLNEFSEIAGKWEYFIEEFIKRNSVGKQNVGFNDFISSSEKYYDLLKRQFNFYVSVEPTEIEKQPLRELGGNACGISCSSAYDLAIQQKETPERGKIILVEDDPMVQRIVSYALKTRSYSFEIIGDGNEARKRILAFENCELPKLLVLDINLPGVDGFSLLKEFQAAGILDKMNTLVLSSHGREDDMIKAFSSGAVDYITKPFSIPVLMFRIEKALTRCECDKD